MLSSVLLVVADKAFADCTVLMIFFSLQIYSPLSLNAGIYIVLKVRCREEYLVVLRVHAGSEKKRICCGVVEDDGVDKIIE